MENILQIRMDRKMYEGKVTYEEGDIIEAVFSEQVEVNPGDPVNCLLSSSLEAIKNFQGIVLARKDKRLILFNPPTMIEFREQRRRYPRFDVNLRGWVRPFEQEAESGKSHHDLPIQLTNVSLGGFAFQSEKQLQQKKQFILYTELYGPNRFNGMIKAQIEILHEKVGKPFLYGCKITAISARFFHALRKYLLERQLEELDLPSGK